MDQEFKSIAELKIDLQEARAQVLSEIDDMKNIDEMEQTLIDSIDNVIEEIDLLQALEATNTDKDAIRRGHLKLAALMQFFDEMAEIVYGDGEEEDFEDDEEASDCDEDGCNHCN